MPFNAKDTQIYREDDKAGHKLLSTEERLKLIKRNLPAVRPRPPPGHNSDRTRIRRSRLSVSSVVWFFRTQLYLLTFNLIHFYFSLYIRCRIAYVFVRDRFYGVLFYHHRTPQIIQRDIKKLKRLPKHLSVILKLEGTGRGYSELEKLVIEVSDVAAWCASAGIPMLSIYEKTGILKSYLSQTHRACVEKLAAYFGDDYPPVTVQAPHLPPIRSKSGKKKGIPTDAGAYELSIMLISAEDGRESMVDLTKTLAEMAQQDKVKSTDISMDLVDAELSESVMGEPDLLLVFAPHVELAGYPPWQVRLTEIFHIRDNLHVGYHVFLKGLYNYAKAEFKVGR